MFYEACAEECQNTCPKTKAVTIAIVSTYLCSFVVYLCSAIRASILVIMPPPPPSSPGSHRDQLGRVHRAHCRRHIHGWPPVRASVRARLLQGGHPNDVDTHQSRAASPAPNARPHGQVRSSRPHILADERGYGEQRRQPRREGGLGGDYRADARPSREPNHGGDGLRPRIGGRL